MPLSWNEIKDRALSFSKEWADTHNEEADAKPFLDAFFHVFGITRKKIATFEHKVKKLDNHDGYIDLFWKGTLLVEMKSKGKDLEKAYKQAREYLQGIKQQELPQYILISDFEKFHLYDYEADTKHEFVLADFVKNVEHFGFIAGYIKREFKEQDPVNIKAANLMGNLHDRLKEIGYTGHALELYLVRLLFCLFAEDTTIFEKDLFTDFIINRTADDGSDLAARLSELFYILNTPTEKRLKTIDEQLNQFPYVNGKLFEETLPPAAFDTQMRTALLECCSLNWGNISPAIFGSMFQSVMNPKERRNLGAHYTSEKNILKLIKPLFLDELWEEFEEIKTGHYKKKETLSKSYRKYAEEVEKFENKREKELIGFQNKISQLKFLDPACGCGNFLVIAYRELRLLEIAILKELYLSKYSTKTFFNINDIIWLDVDMMYGIEYEEFPAQIAQVAMWLIDHQMNMQISREFGQYFVRLPLKKSAKIIHGNALQTDWETVVAKNELSYILGNPPFRGKQYQSKEQKEDLKNATSDLKNYTDLDYVTGWYFKAAKFIQNTKIKVAFVSTNSIVQGEQTSILWSQLFYKYNIKIHFAHRTFKWNNEAKGNAAVYCIVIGFANFDTNDKVIFEYEDIKGEPHEIKAKNINAYLVDAKDILIEKKQAPISNVPKMIYGNKPTDDGNFIFTDEEKEAFLNVEPNAIKYFKKFIGSDEFINNKSRWCIWLKSIQPNELKQLPKILERVAAVKNFREKSTSSSTVKSALYPHLFFYISHPETDYLLIPETSSENRKYIPIGYVSKETIASNSTYLIPSANLYVFGNLVSLMHMAWVKNICGRLKSDYRYTGSIVYNNYPFPSHPTDKQKLAVEEAAQKVLDTRAMFPQSSLADLYNPLTMPAALVKAHNALDKAVDLCYRSQPFTTDANRMEFLFDLYEQYTANLFATTKKSKKKK